MVSDDDQEGVMDNLLEALKTGSAFNVNRDRKEGRRRTPRAHGGVFLCNCLCMIIASVHPCCPVRSATMPCYSALWFCSIHCHTVLSSVCLFVCTLMKWPEMWYLSGMHLCPIVLYAKASKSLAIAHQLCVS